MRPVFLNRRMLAVLLLGFSSGIPLALTGDLLKAWMKTANVDLAVIGMFSLVGLPYGLKVLWSPLMDRFVPPFMGRRRGWILIAQLGLVLAICALASVNPAKAPLYTAVVALVVAFFSASQDIVIDAYKTDVLEAEELGPGAALSITGYRIGMLTSGAIAFILSDHLPWRTVYLLMAATMGLGMLAALFAPEPRVTARPPRTLTDAVVLPFVEFFKRKGAIEILLFVLLYMLGVVMTVTLTTPFMLDLGFTRSNIGEVAKTFGLVATIVGTLVGGAVTARLGLYRSLWVFGVTQGCSALSFATLAHVGHSLPMMVTAITTENLCSGMGTSAYAAFMMSLCDRRFTATQYALFTSLMAITRSIGAAPSGFLAKTMGWEGYFLFCILVSVPGLLLLTRAPRWAAGAAAGEPAAVAG